MTKEELEKLIVYHQNLYYNSVPEIEDWEFDELWDRLKKEYPDSYLLDKVGDEGIIDDDKCEHVIHMGSQEKITSESELSDWIRLKKIEFPVVVQPKLDGISAEIVYENGKLSRVVTRGNGKVGKIITENARLMEGVPKAISIDGIVAVRGEIILPFENVGKLVDVDNVSNVRNMASGIANQKNSTDNLDKLQIICYDITGIDIETEKSRVLLENGFMVPDTYIAQTYEEIVSYINQIKKDRDEKQFGFQIDGSVIKQNSKPDNSDDSKARPDWQRAFKYPVEKVTTRLIGVEWSRNGNNFTPVAILEPVEICDTIVSRASLANLGEIKRLDIKIPCIVTVAKQNDIIPKIHDVVEIFDDSKDVDVLCVCPVCGEELFVSDTVIQCVNEDCVARKEHRIRKWIETVGALGFGEKMIQYLVYDCHVEHISELYCNDIVKYAIEHTNLKKNVQKAFADLWARSKNVELYDFLSGFDMDGLGSKIIKLAVDKGYNTIDALRQVKYEQLVEIDGFGEYRARCFVDNLCRLSDEIDAVLNTNRVTIKALKQNDRTVANGLVFVITGALSRPRSYYETIINNSGNKLGSSVTKKTDYLVTDDPNSGSSKNKRAAELGIKIIDEKEFLRILNG